MFLLSSAFIWIVRYLQVSSYPSYHFTLQVLTYVSLVYFAKWRDIMSQKETKKRSSGHHQWRCNRQRNVRPAANKALTSARRPTRRGFGLRFNGSGGRVRGEEVKIGASDAGAG